MRKILGAVAVSIAAVASLTACSSKNTGSITSKATTVKEGVKGYDILGGSGWKGYGIYFQGQIVTIDYNDDSTPLRFLSRLSLYFEPDGEFRYISFPQMEKGEYTPYKGNGSGESYLLKTKETLFFDYDKKEYVNYGTTEKNDYVITLLDNTTLDLTQYDEESGKKINEDQTIVFVKR